MSRLSARALMLRDRRDEGFSMVEMMVALLIIAIVATASIAFFVNNIQSVSNQRQHQEAVYLADQQLETVESLPVADLVKGRTQAEVTTLFSSAAATALNIASQDDTSNSSDYDPTATAPGSETVPLVVKPKVNGVVYSLTTFIDICWYAKSTGNCGPTSSATTTQEYRVSVWETWTQAGGCTTSCNYSTSTLIDPTSDPTFNANLSQPALLSGPTPGSVKNGNSFTDSCTTSAGTDTGTKVVLTASNLKSGVRVWISTGGGSISKISQPTSTEVDFCLQAGDQPGSYTLSVINTDGGHFQTSITEVPQIRSAVGFQNLGGTVTLCGGGFESNPSVTATGSVSFNTGAVGTDAKCGGLDSLPLSTFSGPSNGAASTITLTNTDGTMATYKITAPTMPGFSAYYWNGSTPVLEGTTAWIAGQTQFLTLNGTNFEPSIAPGLSYVNGGTVSSIKLCRTTGTTPIPPACTSTGASLELGGVTAGYPVSIALFNPDGGNTGLSPILSIPVDAPPAVSSPPTTIVAGKSTVVNGSNFVSGIKGSVSGGTVAVTYVNSGQVQITVTGVSGSGKTVTLTNPDGGYVQLTGLTINPSPTVTSPPTKIAVNTATTINGTGFQSGMTAAISGGTASVTYISSTQIKLTVSGPVGTGETVVLTNPDSGTTSITGLAVDALPTFTSLTETTVIHGQNATWTFNGNGLVSGATYTISENGTQIGSGTTTFSSATKVTFTAAAASSPTGSEPFVVVITNPDGGSVSSGTQNVTVN